MGTCRAPVGGGHQELHRLPRGHRHPPTTTTKRSYSFARGGCVPVSKPLKLIAPVATGPSPPRKLGEHGGALWSRVMTDYQIADAGGVELLAQACGALDRAEALRARIDADGEIIDTPSGPKAHPGLKDELGNRAFVTRCIARLGLDVEPVQRIGRPAARGYTGD